MLERPAGGQDRLDCGRAPRVARRLAALLGVLAAVLLVPTHLFYVYCYSYQAYTHPGRSVLAVASLGLWAVLGFTVVALRRG